jgi:hypothetical protein
VAESVYCPLAEDIHSVSAGIGIERRPATSVLFATESPFKAADPRIQLTCSQSRSHRLAGITPRAAYQFNEGSVSFSRQ